MLNVVEIVLGMLGGGYVLGVILGVLPLLEVSDFRRAVQPAEVRALERQKYLELWHEVFDGYSRVLCVWGDSHDHAWKMMEYAGRDRAALERALREQESREVQVRLWRSMA
jgi:hypothetical protein